jgi:hypothetical protein
MTYPLSVRGYTDPLCICFGIGQRDLFAVGTLML